MKKSKKEQAKIKLQILKTATELIAQNGYKKTSMSKIAKLSGIGEATIYNYFPTKEHILYEYHYELQLKTKQILIKDEEFSQFSLKDQLQFLLETQLELLKNDRSFILEVDEYIFYKSFTHPILEKGNNELKMMADELLCMAIEANEIESTTFDKSLLELFVNYYYGIIYYWIHDESQNFENTTIMIDKSLDVIYTLLKSNLISKLESMVSFIIKTHILNSIKPKKIFKNKKSFGI